MTQRRSDAHNPPTPALYRQIYAIVQCIPRGKVATYGQIARIAGKPRAARAVGGALRSLSEALWNRVPWQRVINAGGECSERGGYRAEQQRERLKDEGVQIDQNGRINLQRFAWKGPSPSQQQKLRRAAAHEASTKKRTAATRSGWMARTVPGS